MAKKNITKSLRSRVLYKTDHINDKLWDFQYRQIGNDSIWSKICGKISNEMENTINGQISNELGIRE